MKKLKMDLEMLAVESFSTAAAEGTDRGTVQAHSVTLYNDESCAWNCSGHNFTRWASCIGGCGASFGPDACTME